jgi:hypothetical protein
MKPILIALMATLLATQVGQCFYNTQTGRWLNRDPLGDAAALGDYLKRNPEKSERALSAESAMLPYAFVSNEPNDRIDRFGLESEPDVSWSPSLCPAGQIMIFVQVLYGGWGPYSGPRVDDGSAGGFGGGAKKGCPHYAPPGMNPLVFQDSPSGTHGALTGPVQFIVCRVCVKPCCWTRNFHHNGHLVVGKNTGYQIASIGPCVYWKKGDKGDFSNGSFTVVDGPPQTWEVAVQTQYPTFATGGCAHCNPYWYGLTGVGLR